MAVDLLILEIIVVIEDGWYNNFNCCVDYGYIDYFKYWYVDFVYKKSVYVHFAYAYFYRKLSLIHTTFMLKLKTIFQFLCQIHEHPEWDPTNHRHGHHRIQLESGILLSGIRLSGILLMVVLQIMLFYFILFL